MGKMIEDLEGYFKSFSPRGDDLLAELQEEAEKENIPIVGPVMGQLLSIMAGVTGARRILELGTANGYSAIWFAKGCADAGGKVVSLESDPEMAKRARENFQRAGVADRVEVREGDAMTEMVAMKGLFDLIFLDIDKQSYAKVLGECERLLEPGGLLIADNTAFNDAKEFNAAIWESDKWEAVNLLTFLPHHSENYDGLCFARRVLRHM